MAEVRLARRKSPIITLLAGRALERRAFSFQRDDIVQNTKLTKPEARVGINALQQHGYLRALEDGAIGSKQKSYCLTAEGRAALAQFVRTYHGESDD